MSAVASQYFYKILRDACPSLPEPESVSSMTIHLEINKPATVVIEMLAPKELVSAFKEYRIVKALGVDESGVVGG